MEHLGFGQPIAKMSVNIGYDRKLKESIRERVSVNGRSTIELDPKRSQVHWLTIINNQRVIKSIYLIGLLVALIYHLGITTRETSASLITKSETHPHPINATLWFSPNYANQNGHHRSNKANHRQFDVSNNNNNNNNNIHHSHYNIQMRKDARHIKRYIEDQDSYPNHRQQDQLGEISEHSTNESDFVSDYNANNIRSTSLTNTDSMSQASSNTSVNLSISSTMLSNTEKPFINPDIFEATRKNLLRHSITVSVIICICYTIVFVVGLVGNSFVVAIVCKSPRMRTVTNYFIANLALADILVLVLCLPATLVSNLYIPYVLGLFVCKTVSYLQGVSVSASINTMVAVTIDRFLAICFPMDWHMSRRVARWTIACIWIFSLGISLPWAIYFELDTFEDTEYRVYVCTDKWPNERFNRIYFICANLILLYVLPGALIMLCYLGIWYKIERRNIPGDRPKGLKIELIMQKSKLKVVKMMMVVVVIFLISWLPLYLIFARLKLGDISDTEYHYIAMIMPLAQWLGASNSCINPILYTFFNRKYKRGFIELLTLGLCCRSSLTSKTDSYGRESRQSEGAMTFNGGACTGNNNNNGSYFNKQHRNNMGGSGTSAITKVSGQRLKSSSITTNDSRMSDQYTDDHRHHHNNFHHHQNHQHLQERHYHYHYYQEQRQLQQQHNQAIARFANRYRHHRSGFDEPCSSRKSTSQSSSTESSTRPSYTADCTTRDPSVDSSLTGERESNVGISINNQLLPCRDRKQQQKQSSITISGKRRFFDHVAGRDSFLIREIRYFRRGLRFDEAKRRREKLLNNLSSNSRHSSVPQEQAGCSNETLKGQESRPIDEIVEQVNDVSYKQIEMNSMARTDLESDKSQCLASNRQDSTTESTEITIVSSSVNVANGIETSEATNADDKCSKETNDQPSNGNEFKDHESGATVINIGPSTTRDTKSDGSTTNSNFSSLGDPETSNDESKSISLDLPKRPDLFRINNSEDLDTVSQERRSINVDSRKREGKMEEGNEDEVEDIEEDDDNLLFGSLHNTPERKRKDINEFPLHEITKISDEDTNSTTVAKGVINSGNMMAKVMICGTSSSTTLAVGEGSEMKGDIREE